MIALPHLVLMKLYAGRSQDIADITRMLGGAEESTLTEVRAAVARHNPDAINDVESMIVLGRLVTVRKQGSGFTTRCPCITTPNRYVKDGQLLEYQS